MKIIILPVFIIAYFFQYYNICTEGNSECFGKDKFKEEGWYSRFLNSLTQEWKIDSLDAKTIKGTNSNSRIAFDESISSIISSRGKINEEDIQCIYKLNGESLIFIQTRSDNYNHLFIYDFEQFQLKRIKNKSSFVVSGYEKLKLEILDKNIALFYTESSNPEDWKKYFLIDMEKGVLTHAKNCHSINKVEECITFNK